MATVVFTANLRRHVDTESCQVEASTVRQALEAIFEEQPSLRHYLLDDQGAVRKHVTIFVDGEPIHDRTGQSDTIHADAEIYIAQALSGG